jgi:uncharacterized protein (TIGR03083 family)
MSEWNGMTFEAKDNMLRVVRQEAEGFFALASKPDTWEMQTACTNWQVRDAVGHLIDVTENYFQRFDAARANTDVQPAYGVTGMAQRADEQAEAFRGQDQQELVERLRTDFDKMMGILEGLSEDDWSGLTVSHYYMGPLPAFFYPAFQLMDYGVHSWDIRQGAGRAHALSGEAADLLVPFMFVLWQATAAIPEGTAPYDFGVRILGGNNAGDYVLHITPEGLSYEQGDVSEVDTVMDFDAGSFVLTTFGRVNGGTIRGDRTRADDYLNLFFRI